MLDSVFWNRRLILKSGMKQPEIAMPRYLVRRTLGSANVDAAWDNVATKITSSTDCAVAFSIPVAPSPHTVNRNDRAFFYENASWNDTRAANSPTATHRFPLKIQWAVT